MNQQFLVAPPQVDFQASTKAGFEDSDTANNLDIPRTGETPCDSFVDNCQVSRKLSGKQHCGQFSCAQRVNRTQALHFRCGTRRVDLDPIREADGFCDRTPGAADNHLLTHFFRDVYLYEELAEQIKLKYPRESDQWGGIGNNDHSLRRVAVLRSSARSSSV